MKSSTGSSLSVLVVTFLNASPAFLVPAAWAGAAPRACGAALYMNAKPLETINVIAAVSISRNESFMLFLRTKIIRLLSRKSFRQFNACTDRIRNESDFQPDIRHITIRDFDRDTFLLKLFHERFEVF